MKKRPSDELPQGRDEEAAEWCLRLSESELASAEQRLFEAWLGEPGNGTAFDEAVAVWRAAEIVSGRPALIAERAAALDRFRQANSARWRRKERRWPWISGISAAFLAALSSSLLLIYDAGEQYETNIGERRVAMLEDGSRVSLDAASRVDVRIADDKRQLTLMSGRVKFDVAKDPLRPFSVLAGDKIVVATVTSFSVELLGDQVRVLLYEGKVDVLDRSDSAIGPQRIKLSNAALSAGQALTPGHELVMPVSETSAVIDAADVSRSLAWEAGQLNFDNEPLPIAVQRMNRYSREKLHISESALASIRVNGVFATGDVDAFVEGVSTLYGLKASRVNGYIILTQS